MNALAVQDVSHAFGERKALQNLSLTVPTGVRFALLGPNGSGKTTLFRVLSTLLRAQSGSVRVHELDVAARPDDVRRLLGVVFQSPSVDKRLTVGENLLCHGMLLGIEKSTLQARIESRLEQFELADRRGDVVDTLSGGLKRRVELAKALLHEPRVLLLDEPTTGLDPNAREQFWGMIHQLTDGGEVTVVYTTHAFDEAERCQQVAVLREGAVIASGSPSELRKGIKKQLLTVRGRDGVQLGQRVAEQFGLSGEERHDGLHLEVDRETIDLSEVLAALEPDLDSYHWRRPDLGDVYTQLTGETFRAGDET